MTWTKGVIVIGVFLLLPGLTFAANTFFFSNSTLDFGNVTIGQTTFLTLTIANIPDSKSDVDEIQGSVFALPSGGNCSSANSTVFSNPAFSIVSGGGGFDLGPGQKKDIKFSFSPSAALTYSDTVCLKADLVHFDSSGNKIVTPFTGSPYSIPLNGKGVSASINLEVSLTSVSFGDVVVGQAATQTLRITNLSNSTDSLDGTVGNLSSPFFVISGGGSFSLPPGQSKQIQIGFSPVALGTATATLSITHNATSSNCSTPGTCRVSLTGTGVETINLSISPLSVDFGNVPVSQSATQTITLTNDSNSTGILEGTIGIPLAPFSVASGGGTFSLPPGRSKTVTIRYAPTAVSIVPDQTTLFITHNASNSNCGTPSPCGIKLTGRGVELIKMSISPTPVDFGNIAVGQTIKQTLTLTNSSTSTGLLEGSVGSLTSPFSIASGGGSFSLSPGQSRSVTISFSPTSSGITFTDTLFITHNATTQTSPTSVTITGTGVEVINLSVNPSPVNFGNVAVNQFSNQTLTITNSATSTTILEGDVDTTGLSSPFSVVSGGGSFSLLPGGSKIVTIRFAPTAPGTVSGTLKITHNATNPSSPTNVLLTGTGTSVINVAITPTSISFGNILVGQSARQTLTITNLSSSAGVLEGTVGTLSAPFILVSGGGSFSLAPGQSRSVILGFSPTLAGNFSDTLVITHSATNQPSPTNVSVSGTGVPVINMSVSPSPLSFGSILLGQSATQTLTITNSSASTDTLTGSVAGLSAPFLVVSGGSSFSLAPGKSRTVVVSFTPTATGTFSDTLTITHNATNQTSPINLAITGTGEVSVVNMEVSPGSVDFGGVIVGKSITQTIVITNASSSTTTLEGSVDSLSGPFSLVSGGGTFSLVPGKSKSITVNFSPTSTGNFSQTLSITHNATNQGSPALVSLNGTGLPAVNLTFSPSSVDFGNILVGQSSNQTITITNQSTSTGTLDGSIGNVVGPFSVISGGGTFSLAPGKSRSVVINFSPTVSGTFSQTLSFTHNATNQSSPTGVTLTGTGVLSTINIDVSANPLDFSDVQVGRSTTQTLIITNLSSSTDTLEGSIGSLSGPFFVASGGGTFSLSPGKSRSVVISFSPTSEGIFSQTLEISHNATNSSSPTGILLKGNGTPAINLSINPASLAFGNLTVNDLVNQTLTITNLPSSSNTLEGSVGNLSAPFSVVSGGGVFSLAPGKSKTIIISFSPTFAGSFSQTLPITHNATNQPSPTGVLVSGTGLSEVININIEIVPNPVSFGSIPIGEVSRQTLTITNLANSTGTLEGSVSTLSSPFSIVSGLGPFSLPPGRSQTVLVTFSPTSEGAASQTLTITHNATNTPGPVEVLLTGTGLPRVNILVSPTPVNFGNVILGKADTQTFVIINDESSTGTLTGNVGGLSDPFSIISGGGAFSLAPKQSRTVVVRFTPTSLGSFSQTLSITHNATNTPSPIQFPVNGTGTVTINLSISSTSLGFGNIAVGKSSVQTITITNDLSSTALLIGSVGSPTGPFSVARGGGPFSLEPGKSLSVVVGFSPPFAGIFSGVLTITHNATNQSTPLNVLLTGATPIGWGIGKDIPVPRDYDGDKKADLAVWRPSEGNWYILASSNPIPFVPAWGLPGDKPVPADYDGDGKADLAVFRPSTGTWLILNSSGGIVTENFGASTDTPVPGDYDGDGKTDLAVFKPSLGEWDIKPSRGGVIVQALWGLRGDIPVPGDYDGDKRTDLAVWRPTEGIWYITFSSGGSIAMPWGLPGDTPLPRDYNGDGKTDLAIWRSKDGTWNLALSDGTVNTTLWGLPGDIPVPADYNGDGRVDIAVWRPKEGNWYILF